MRIALLLVILGVSAMAELPGRYELQGVREVGSELVLDQNGTYEFALIYGAADFSSKGTWKSEGGFVILTAEKSDAKAFKLLRSGSVKAAGIHVWVKGPDGRGVENIDVQAGTVQRRTGGDGQAEFPEVKSPTGILLHVPVYEVEAGPFPLKAPDNDVTFEINGDAITRVPFDHERLRIDGDVLELRFYDKNKPMRYQRLSR